MFQFMILVDLARLQWEGLGGGKWAGAVVRKPNIDINCYEELVMLEWNLIWVEKIPPPLSSLKEKKKN